MFVRSTRRRLLAATLGTLVPALVLAVPGIAQAQLPSVDEACSDSALGSAAGEKDPFCVGIRKLAERASAECRRVGIPEEHCYTGSGRRVIRASVDAHQSSLVHRALAFQYRLGNTVPLRDAPWIGTHNSYNSTSEMPTLSHTDSNQQLSLVDQLEIDIRSLELDIHWQASARTASNPASAAETRGRGPVVCHARPADEMHAGCTTERLLSDVLAEVRSWLDANRDQVLLVYLEDHIADGPEATTGVGDDGLDPQARHARVARVLDDRLGSLIYRPAPSGDCTKLPLDLTREKVLQAGARVVLVSGCDAGSVGWSHAVFNWKSGDIEKEERPERAPDRRFKDYPDCGPHYSRSDYDTYLIRYYEDSTWIAHSPVGTPDDGITPATAAAMTRCGVDLFGLDQILPEDGRLESLVWTWTAGDPPSDEECAVQRADSRWATRGCREKRPAACRAADGSWTVTAEPVSFTDAAARCTDVGGRFDLPRTGYDNVQLRDATGSGGGEVWLDHGEPPKPEPESEDPVNPGSGAAAAPPAPGPSSGGAARGVDRTHRPVRARRGRATARCHVRRRRVVLCRVVPAARRPALAQARLARRGRTYARGKALLRGRRGTLRLRSRRVLRRGTYAVTLRVGSAGAATRLRVRLRVR